MTEPSATGAGALELSVIAPCYNEEENIDELTERVMAALDTASLIGELVLVDDGSRDGTAEAIREQMQRNPGRVVGQFHGHNQGMAAAWRTGAAAARGTHVAIIDADLQYQPEEIPVLYRELLASGVDIVQGWRSSVQTFQGSRTVLSRGLNAILNGVFGMRLRDNKSGFLCCPRPVFQDLLTYRGHYAYWQSFIMVAAHAKGYRYLEVRAEFRTRQHGESFLARSAYRAAFRNLVDVGRAFREYRLGRPGRHTR